MFNSYSIKNRHQHLPRKFATFRVYSQEGTTQGDPLALAMAMYAIAITPLIYQLEDTGIKQAWYADDATAGGSLN